jgi:membrane protein YqaA with SNARE-associated domain
MNRLTKKIYNWGVEQANMKWGLWFLFSAGIADASFFPLPVTTLLVTLSLLNRKNTMKYILFLTMGIVTGATAAYITGHFLWLDGNMQFTSLGRFFIDNIPGFSVSAYERIHTLFDNSGSWILLAATASPLPYGMFSVSSGIFNSNLFIFILVTTAGHTIKYLALTYMAGRIGPSLRTYFRLLWKPVTIIPMVLAAITFAVLKFI